jgi:two-component sensor histidine kinase/CheY-like chemotaxis protein
MTQGENIDRGDPDDDLLLDDEEDAELPASNVAGEGDRATSGVWKVLIVDDDPDVRFVSELALRGLTIDDKPVQPLFAASSAEAKRVLAEHEDVAVLLVDVVMESERAGLELVRWIRDVLGNWSVRLVLRTGEPGSAPESLVMADHQLHDYLSKSETTSRRLASCVTGAVRAWRDQRTIELQRVGLQNVLQGVGSLFENYELSAFFQMLVRTAPALLSPQATGAWFLRRNPDAPEGWESLASVSGEPAPRATLERMPLELGSTTVRRGCAAHVFDVQDDAIFALVLVRDEITPWEGKLVEIFGQSVALSLRHRTRWESALDLVQRSLNEREVMLREIHHRVKNNLQVTASMLSLQVDRCTSPEARWQLVDSCSRVRTMALVHQQLCTDEDLVQLSFSNFVRVLVASLRSSIAPDAQLQLHAEQVRMTIDQAMPCGLILNEILTNAMKHGRAADGTLRIDLGLRRQGDSVFISVRDGGAGLPGTLEELTENAIGLKMVRALSRQVGATMRVTNDAGAHFEVELPMEPA